MESDTAFEWLSVGRIRRLAATDSVDRFSRRRMDSIKRHHQIQARQEHRNLNGFEGSPPFSIQRYLRAVEKSLLVTSTWDTFPALTEKERTYSAATQAPIATSSSTPNTPIFSPIPFLHEDARSSSRSPPPSPLSLPAAAGGSVMGPETKALGLVDELDDLGPGHLSDHPHPLSATTTMSTRSFRGSLEERFIRAREEDTEGRQPQMEDDEELMDEDKENKA
ncbi:hypothetical protein A0H81_04251 [Grifola frondosa]|uniref:Uncharacterized protein n=1 Tax=Grifola frondosa TaxID=5627 RepID=A0A1C7MGX7_GRIFR|nr:hypothetical protein A0H81_04251 [Grifola frondosa]